MKNIQLEKDRVMADLVKLGRQKEFEQVWAELMEKGSYVVQENGGYVLRRLHYQF